MNLTKNRFKHVISCDLSQRAVANSSVWRGNRRGNDPALSVNAHPKPATANDAFHTRWCNRRAVNQKRSLHFFFVFALGWLGTEMHHHLRHAIPWRDTCLVWIRSEPWVTSRDFASSVARLEVSSVIRMRGPKKITTKVLNCC